MRRFDFKISEIFKNDRKIRQRHKQWQDDYRFIY